MSNTILVTFCIFAIIIVGHLYIKNILIKNNRSNIDHNILTHKKVTFGNENIKYIPNNDTIKQLNDINPPDNIVIDNNNNNNNNPLENELKNHIDSIYTSDSIVYDEKHYKKDTLSGYAENTINGFSQFGDNTDYYPYSTNERKLINKYNNHSSSHFTDDNFDIGSFFNDNQEFNDTTSPFVDNSKYNDVKSELDKSNILVAPPLVDEGYGSNVNCDPYNNFLNKNNKELNKHLVNNDVVNVDGQSLESWQYNNENVINGGQIKDGLRAFTGFDEIYSDVNNVTEGKCHQ